MLDNEAVQALQNPAHPKHRRVVSLARGRGEPEAACRHGGGGGAHRGPRRGRVDRTSPAWVFPNRLRIADVPLDAARASTAAAIRHRTGVSVADAHLGAVDPGNVGRAADHGRDQRPR